MSPNAFVMFPLESQPKVRPMRPPRGTLVQIGLNPFTQNLVFSYQKNNVSLEYIDLIIKQIYSQVMAMADLGLEPTVESYIEFIKDGNKFPPDSEIALKEIA